MIPNARTFYCNTPNYGVLQTYHLLCSNTCQRRSDHVQLVTTGLYPNMRVRKYSDSPALIFFQVVATFGESVNRFADFGLLIAQKCVWRPGSAQTRWGSYSAPADPLAVVRGTGGEGPSR